MEKKSEKRGNGMVQPNQAQPNANSNKGVKKIPAQKDGLMEREEITIVTEDGRELLK